MIKKYCIIGFSGILIGDAKVYFDVMIMIGFYTFFVTIFFIKTQIDKYPFTCK